METKRRTGYLFKRGKTFYVSWVVNGKKFTRALYDSEGNPITSARDAEQARIEVMKAYVVGDEAAALESIVAKLDGRKAELARLEDEKNPVLNIANAWAEYLRSPNRPDSGESTLRQYAFQFARFEAWMAEQHPEAAALREVTKGMAEDYAAHLATEEKLSANTYNKHLNLLTLVFRVLKGKGRLGDNPWADIQRKRLTTQSRRELTVEELRKVCTKAKGELRKLLALGVYSGLRLGDCATLRWGEVDLLRGIIRRVPNKTARRKATPVIVPIHPVLREMLSEKVHGQRGEYVLPGMAESYFRRVDSVTDQIQKHFKKCGIVLHKTGTGGTSEKRAVVDIGFHSLRHTFVSLCRESGAPLAVVESIVGHSNPAMTRHYTHVGELAASQAVAALPTLIGEPAKPTLSAPSIQEKVLSQVRAIAKTMTAKNWKRKQAELLALVPDMKSVLEKPLIEVQSTGA